MNQTIRRHSQWSYLSVCWGASGDASLERGGIYGDLHGVVEIYMMGKETP